MGQREHGEAEDAHSHRSVCFADTLLGVVLEGGSSKEPPDFGVPSLADMSLPTLQLRAASKSSLRESSSARKVLGLLSEDRAFLLLYWEAWPANRKERDRKSHKARVSWHAFSEE